MMADLTPRTEAFLAASRDALAWLQDDGYREVKLLPVRSRFHLSYSSARGRVALSVDAARRTAEVMLAPPDGQDALKPIDSLRDRSVSLEAVRAIHELPPVDGSLGTDSDEASIARLREYLRGLQELRGHELGGDWSRFDEAFQHRSAGAAAEVERIRDPQLRAIMRQYRPPR
jgi:hypothetical protein